MLGIENDPFLSNQLPSRHRASSSLRLRLLPCRIWTWLSCGPQAEGVLGAADDVITHAGEVFHPASTYEHTECSCRLWPMPGMYAVTSIPLVSRTRGKPCGVPSSASSV